MNFETHEQLLNAKKNQEKEERNLKTPIKTPGEITVSKKCGLCQFFRSYEDEPTDGCKKWLMECDMTEDPCQFFELHTYLVPGFYGNQDLNGEKKSGNDS